MSPARRRTWTWCETSAWARPSRARRSDTHIPGSCSDTGPVRGPGALPRSTSMRSRSGSPMARRQRRTSSRGGASTMPILDVGQVPGPHWVRLHQTPWVRVLQETELARTFVLGVFTAVVQMPYGYVQGASPVEGSASQAPHSSALNVAAGSLLPDIAEWAVQAPSRLAFRRGVVDRLKSALMLEAA